MNKNIPFFSLERQYKANKENLQKKVLEVLDSQRYVGGPYVQNFEESFSSYTKAKHTISCNSGTDALWMALKALEIKANDIVLTTPFSFIASSSEIVAHGANPVFIDIDKQTYNLDTNKLENWLKANINKDTGKHKTTGFPVVGIIAVDIFGQCTNYKELKRIANEWNLWIIEDACQAVGSSDSSNTNAGNFGDISCFSFYPTKNLGAFGDGGCSTTNNDELAQKLIQIRNHGRKSHYNYEYHGVNSRLDAIQAVILTEKLKELDTFNDNRRKIAQIYNEELANIDLIQLPKEINGKHVYHQYCIKVNGDENLRNKLMTLLKKAGVATNIYYPKGLDEIGFLNKNKSLKNECPISKNLTQTVIALPIWPELTKEEVLYVCQSIKDSIDKV